MTNRALVKAEQRKKMMLFSGFVGFMLLTSVTIGLIPISIVAPWFAVVSSALIWTGLIGTVAAAVLINARRKKSIKETQKNKLHLPGVFKFFRNTEAMVMDIIMILSFVQFVVSLLWIPINWLRFLCLSIFVFSFGMHSMLNGINYEYIKQKVRRDEDL